MSLKLLENWLFRPQGKPMAYPVTLAAKFSQFPYRFVWHEAWVVRYFFYAQTFITLPLYYRIDKVLTGPANTKLWAEKRKKDLEDHRHHMEKIWEVRT